MSDYRSAVPDKLADATAALSKRDGLGFAVLLALDDDGPFRFSELQTELDVHQGTLSTVLSELQSGGLVRKRPGDRIGDRSTGPYELAPFGDDLLDGFEYAYAPERYALEATEETQETARVGPRTD